MGAGPPAAPLRHVLESVCSVLLRIREALKSLLRKDSWVERTFVGITKKNPSRISEGANIIFGFFRGRYYLALVGFSSFPDNAAKIERVCYGVEFSEHVGHVDGLDN